MKKVKAKLSTASVFDYMEELKDSADKFEHVKDCLANYRIALIELHDSFRAMVRELPDDIVAELCKSEEEQELFIDKLSTMIDLQEEEAVRNWEDYSEAQDSGCSRLLESFKPQEVKHE